MNAMNPIEQARSMYVFELGALCSTPAAIAALGRRGMWPGELMVRHAMGDFGDDFIGGVLEG